MKGMASRSATTRNAPPGPNERLAIPTGVRVDLDDLIRLGQRPYRLPLSPLRRTREMLSGGNLSRFRARGMEYAESRAYLPGDDIRSMDWRVTARTGRPHTKLFQEERDRPVILITDFSPSMFFGTRSAFKSVVAAHTAAILAWSAMRGGDRIGGLVTSESNHAELRPAGGRRGVLQLLRALCDLGRSQRPAGSAGDSLLLGSLAKARQVVRPGSLVIMISDFYGLDERTEQSISSLRQHNDMIACWVVDPLEVKAPPAGRYAVSDGSATTMIDTAPRETALAYAQYFESRRAEIQAACTRQDVPVVRIDTGRDVEAALRTGLVAARSRATHGYRR